ncbi:MAG: hypothetical protein K2X01_03010 [Cyanobacteria bacterium]|nr:hypothetical protein [Cyanobacteriota bacterium]
MSLGNYIKALQYSLLQQGGINVSPEQLGLKIKNPLAFQQAAMGDFSGILRGVGANGNSSSLFGNLGGINLSQSISALSNSAASSSTGTTDTNTYWQIRNFQALQAISMQLRQLQQQNVQAQQEARKNNASNSSSSGLAGVGGVLSGDII